MSAPKYFGKYDTPKNIALAIAYGFIDGTKRSNFPLEGEYILFASTKKSGRVAFVAKVTKYESIKKQVFWYGNPRAYKVRLFFEDVRTVKWEDYNDILSNKQVGAGSLARTNLI